ncbi:hypothetical protein [Asticcacaulis sp. AND118]|uniref:hypothetical protein n=1 Tax=Asticcacaulis sp. AND118 TaxID=2840468 RepID=UPI001CFF760A|nr:hypothetical protein [Asticcacaulis sp. AND118]UDF05357.1 hypothetical protein LH365_14200 [Asticcacaulis sp. AND118]
MKSNIYGVAAGSYLHRARERLLDGTKESLFYAALELRCCVETRQAEYLEHLNAYKGKKVRPYKIGDNRSKIEKISGGKVIARMTFHFEDELFIGYHTPVPLALVQYCEQKIDNLRHAQPYYRDNDDPWWEEVRQGLVSNYRLAWISCKGNMLVPPLWGNKGKDVHPMVFDVDEQSRAVIQRLSQQAGRQFKAQVEYLETPPEDWVCDL